MHKKLLELWRPIANGHGPLWRRAMKNLSSSKNVHLWKSSLQNVLQRTQFTLLRCFHKVFYPQGASFWFTCRCQILGTLTFSLWRLKFLEKNLSQSKKWNYFFVIESYDFIFGERLVLVWNVHFRAFPDNFRKIRSKNHRRFLVHINLPMYFPYKTTAYGMQ